MIQSLTMTDHTDEETTFSVRCGKGTYIRSLARDIGRALGSAHMWCFWSADLLAGLTLIRQFLWISLIRWSILRARMTMSFLL